MPPTNAHSFIADAIRARLLRARLSVASGYFYFGYWFSRSRA